MGHDQGGKSLSCSGRDDRKSKRNIRNRRHMPIGTVRITVIATNRYRFANPRVRHKDVPIFESGLSAFFPVCVAINKRKANGSLRSEVVRLGETGASKDLDPGSGPG